MKNTVVIDTFSIDGFHEVFNASFLYVILNSTIGPVTYIADKSAIKAIQELLKEDQGFRDAVRRVRFKPKTLPKGLSFYAIFFRYLYGAFLNIFYMFKYKERRVIFPALNPIFSLFLKFILKIGKIETYVVCHGELGYLFSKYRKTSPLFWYSAFMRPFFKGNLPEKNLKLIMLGGSIVQNFTAKYPHLAPNIISMHHPYIFKDFPAKTARKSSSICFGWVGVATEAKGFSVFNEIANCFSEKYPDRFLAYLVGWHPFKLQEYPHINFLSQPNIFLDRSEFNKGVAKLDYILFLYDNEHYRYTASGAIFDAIQQEKLIIALRNDYFESIFNVCGPIGFLCETKEEIFQVIEAVLNDKIDVKQFFVNLKIARNIFDSQHMKIIF